MSGEGNVADYEPVLLANSQTRSYTLAAYQARVARRSRKFWRECPRRGGRAGQGVELAGAARPCGMKWVFFRTIRPIYMCVNADSEPATFNNRISWNSIRIR